MGFFSNRTKEEKVDNSEIGKWKRELEKQRVEKAQAEAEMAYKEEQELARKLGIAKAFSIHDADSEKKILQTKLLEKWDNVFQRENIIDKLRFFETVEEKKRFIAESFSIELTNDAWKAEETNYLELIYETQGNQLVFKFSKKENSDSEFVLCLEYKTAQESDNIKTEITGTTNNSAQCKGLYGFLCSLNQPEMAAYMDAFFTKVKEAEQNKLETNIYFEKEDDEHKFIREELLKKWNDIIQRKDNIDKLKSVEYEKETKRFIADDFSISLIFDKTQKNNPKFLELSYEAHDIKLIFEFLPKEATCNILKLGVITKQKDRNIENEISGRYTGKPDRDYGLYVFLYSLNHRELAVNMKNFLDSLSNIESKLKDELLNKKYSSILDDLSTL